MVSDRRFHRVTRDGAAASTLPPRLDSLGAFGLTFTAGEVVCEDSPSAVCGRSVQALNATFGDEQVTLAPGDTQTLAGLTLTLSMYDQLVDHKWCDASPRFILGAFAAGH